MGENQKVYKLLELIQDQSVIQFTGRLNLLCKQTNQLLGVIVLKEGQPIFTKFKSSLGYKGYLYAVVDDPDLEKMNVVVEPEVVDDVPINIGFSAKILDQKVLEEAQQLERSRALRPPGHLRMKLRTEFLMAGEKISEIEFDLMCLLTKPIKVETLYAESPLLEHDITMGLVSLRKKKALLVG